MRKLIRSLRYKYSKKYRALYDKDMYWSHLVTTCNSILLPDTHRKKKAAQKDG